MGGKQTKEQKAELGKTLCNIIDSNKAIRYTILLNGLVIIGCALIAVVGGALLLNYTWKPDQGSPIIVSSGIWGGAYCLALGCMAVAVASKSVSPKSRLGLFYGHFVMAMCSFGVTIQMILLHSESWQDCDNDDNMSTTAPPYCTPNTEDIITVSLMVYVVSIVVCACVGIIAIYYGVVSYKASKAMKSYGMDRGHVNNIEKF